MNTVETSDAFCAVVCVCCATLLNNFNTDNEHVFAAFFHNAMRFVSFLATELQSDMLCCEVWIVMLFLVPKSNLTENKHIVSLSVSVRVRATCYNVRV